MAAAAGDTATTASTRMTLEQRVQAASIAGVRMSHMVNAEKYARHLAAIASAAACGNAAPPDRVTIANLLELMEQRVIDMKML
jgi:hypothetical protein